MKYFFALMAVGFQLSSVSFGGSSPAAIEKFVGSFRAVNGFFKNESLGISRAQIDEFPTSLLPSRDLRFSDLDVRMKVKSDAAGKTLKLTIDVSQSLGDRSLKKIKIGAGRTIEIVCENCSSNDYRDRKYRMRVVTNLPKITIKSWGSRPRATQADISGVTYLGIEPTGAEATGVFFNFPLKESRVAEAWMTLEFQPR